VKFSEVVEVQIKFIITVLVPMYKMSISQIQTDKVCIAVLCGPCHMCTVQINQYVVQNDGIPCGWYVVLSTERKQIEGATLTNPSLTIDNCQVG
jgi:hypothetical protein